MLLTEDGQTGLKITLNAHGHVQEGYNTEQDNATTLCELNSLRSYEAIEVTLT